MKKYLGILLTSTFLHLAGCGALPEEPEAAASQAQAAAPQAQAATPSSGPAALPQASGPQQAENPSARPLRAKCSDPECLKQCLDYGGSQWQCVQGCCL